jgi:hypothetical protein
MGLRDLRDDQGRTARPNLTVGYAQSVHLSDPRFTSMFISCRPKHVSTRACSRLS